MGHVHGGSKRSSTTARHGEGRLRTLGPLGVIYTEPLFSTNSDTLTSPHVAGILATSLAPPPAGRHIIEMTEGGEDGDDDPPHHAADRGGDDNPIGDALRARRPCCRETERRVLGSLGPGANEPLEKLCREWAEKEKVELKTDFITSNGDKDLLTVAAEAQSKSGHDILTFTAWYAPGQAENLEPVDDVMAELIRQHGAVSAGAEYLGKQDGHWVAVPTSFGSTLSPPRARIDLMKQIVALPGGSAVRRRGPVRSSRRRRSRGRKRPGARQTGMTGRQFSSGPIASCRALPR